MKQNNLGAVSDLPPSMPPAAAIEAAPRRFRWRYIPAVLLGLYGSIAALVSVDALYIELCGYGCSVVDYAHLASDSRLRLIMIGMVLLGIHGILALAAGIQIWRQRWKQSGVLIAATIGLMVIMDGLKYVVHQLPPGENIRSPRQPPAHHINSDNSRTPHQVEQDEDQSHQSQAAGG